MPKQTALRTSCPRTHRGQLVCTVLLALTAMSTVGARPYIPADDAAVLAHLSPGTTHTSMQIRRQAAARLDVALPLAQFYISQARASGDSRFLGYAEAALAPWVAQATPLPAALVLQATVQQSRHEFTAALATLDRALLVHPGDVQAWLTRATVLRVLGRYTEAA